MNTIRSVGYGWGVLIVAGGGSYYFAKRSINADRAERAEAEERRRQQREKMRIQQMIAQQSSAGTGSGAGPRLGNVERQKSTALGNDNPSPSEQVVTGDPAPVGDEHKSMARRGKYEAAEPYRAPKGDRFS